MNQSGYLTITCDLLKAQEKSRVQGDFGFASNWLKNLRKTFKPITKFSNLNRVITFDIHLKTALKLFLQLLVIILFEALQLQPKESTLLSWNFPFHTWRGSQIAGVFLDSLDAVTTGLKK